MPSQEVKARLFRCKNCKDHFWWERASPPDLLSECWECHEQTRAIPDDDVDEKNYEKRQFECNCRPNRHLWWETVCKTERVIRSKCRYCHGLSTPIPKGEEKGVGACKFECQRGHRFTVVCEMTDTAECYRCGEPEVAPYEFTPPRHIKKTTDNKHSCSKCKGRDNCPNMRQLHEIVQSSS